MCSGIPRTLMLGTTDLLARAYPHARMPSMTAMLAVLTLRHRRPPIGAQSAGSAGTSHGSATAPVPPQTSTASRARSSPWRGASSSSGLPGPAHGRHVGEIGARCVDAEAVQDSGVALLLLHEAARVRGEGGGISQCPTRRASSGNSDMPASGNSVTPASPRAPGKESR